MPLLVSVIYKHNPFKYGYFLPSKIEKKNNFNSNIKMAFPTTAEVKQKIEKNRQSNITHTEDLVVKWVSKAFNQIISDLKVNLYSVIKLYSTPPAPYVVKVKGKDELESKLENFLKKHGYKAVSVKYFTALDRVHIYFRFDEN